jgi:hypothetical protein
MRLIVSIDRVTATLNSEDRYGDQEVADQRHQLAQSSLRPSA